MTRPPTPTEFDIIARYFAPLTDGAPGAQGLRDDAAVLSARPDREIVVSTDTIVEGVHFLAGECGSVVAERMLAVGFSDIAAMGAAPTGYTLSLALPRSLTGTDLTEWLERFVDGLRKGQDTIGSVLIGGDTVVAPAPLALTLTAFGEVTPGASLHRHAAQPGDDVWVSGTIGDAALGLAALIGTLTVSDAEARECLVQRYRRPTARVALGQGLTGLARAAADISDGLIADLGHICMASGVQASIRADAVPLSEAARSVVVADPAWLSSILAGGDDYELVFTAPPSSAGALADLSARLELPLTSIGQIELGPNAESPCNVTVFDDDGRHVRLDRIGYEHL